MLSTRQCCSCTTRSDASLTNDVVCVQVRDVRASKLSKVRCNAVHNSKNLHRDGRWCRTYGSNT